MKVNFLPDKDNFHIITYKEITDLKKKVCIILLSLVLSGGLFALDTIWSVSMYGTVILAEGINGEDQDDVLAGGGFGRIRFSVGGTSDDNNFGGIFSLEMTGGDVYGGMNSGYPMEDGMPVAAYGYAWWKPIEYFQLLIGYEPYGLFPVEGVALWMFHQRAGDTGTAFQGWVNYSGNNQYNRVFYEGFRDPGAVFSFYPADGLAIEIGIPLFGDTYLFTGTKSTTNKAWDIYGKTNAQISYFIDGIGRLAITYAGNLGNDFILENDDDPWSDTNPVISANTASIFGYLGINAFDNLSLDFGAGYQLRYGDIVDADTNTKITYNPPIAVGFAAAWQGYDFGLKTRVMGLFAESWDEESNSGTSTNTKGDIVVLADIMPYINFGESFRFFLNGGITYNKPDGGNASYGWHINPYFTVSTDWGATSFHAGFLFGARDTKDKIYNWSVPVAISVSF